MNQKTAKLLRSYATYADMNYKELKKWWNSLSWRERTIERKRMIEDLGMEEEVEQETTEEEEESE